MTDFRALAGQTVDGYYYLRPNDIIQQDDELLTVDLFWIKTAAMGCVPNGSGVTYRRPVADCSLPDCACNPGPQGEHMVGCEWRGSDSEPSQEPSELDRIRAEIEDRWQDWGEELTAEVQRLRAENAELRRQIDAADIMAIRTRLVLQIAPLSLEAKSALHTIDKMKLIVVCVGCGAWKLFWRRAHKSGWRNVTQFDGIPAILCSDCYRCMQ